MTYLSMMHTSGINIEQKGINTALRAEKAEYITKAYSIITNRNNSSNYL